MEKEEKEYINKASKCARKEDYEGAVTWYQKAVEVNPKNGSTYDQLGWNLSLLGRYEDAIAALKKSIEIAPNNDFAWLGLGEQYTSLGNFEEALKAYEKVLQLDPGNEYAYGNKGFALYNLGKIKESIQWYDRQIRVSSDDFLTYLKKGKALQDLKEGTEALKCFQKGMDLIDEGDLDGNTFTFPNSITSTLNKLEVDLVANIKELLAIPTVQVTSDKPEVKAKAQELDKRKDALKLKFINAALSAKKEASKKEELGQLKKELEELKKNYTDLNTKVTQVEADIQDSGVGELAEVKRKFKALEKQPELLAYCKTFYWTAINLFGAYRVMSTGLAQANFKAEATTKEDLIVKGAKKATSLLADVAKGVPLVGGVMSLLDKVIDGIYGAVKENRFNNKVAAINKVIQAKLGTEDEISLNVLKAALALTSAREQTIAYPETLSSNPDTISEKVKKGLKWLADKVDEIKEKVLPSVELHDPKSAGATLALQDVTLFMAYICKNHASLIKNEDDLDKQIASIVEFNGLENMLEDRDDDMPEGKNKTDNDMQEVKNIRNPGRIQCCNMF